MAYYNPCPECGANLDPGEKCDCNKKESACQSMRTSGQRYKNYTLILTQKYKKVKRCF